MKTADNRFYRTKDTMKTETKHTLGPWTIQQESEGTLDVVHSSGEIRSRIARIHVEYLCAEHGGSPLGNARLIASAPDLIAQRDELRELLNEASENDMPYGASWIGQHDWLKRVRAALAKCEPQGVKTTSQSFYIFVDRGDGKLSNDGCWGGEHNHFESREAAREAITKLAEAYDDCDWVICDRDNNEIERCGKSGFSVQSPQAFPKGRWA